jgi:SecD/SecF fusion protein
VKRALVLLVVLVMPACAGGSDSGTGVEVELQAQPVSGAVRRSELEEAAAILEERLELEGIKATVTDSGDSRVVIRLDRPRTGDADRVVELATRTGLLELYDLEANLVSPSIDANGFPVATASLYDLLVGRQSGAREDEVESWYLFDTEKRVAGGPVALKQLLLPNGRLLAGWRILGTPPGTVVLECGIGEIVCPGVDVENPRRDAYYLITYDPPRVPELDGSDLKLEGTRQDFDTVTGEPIVTMQFSREGGEKFGDVTKEEAQRGRLQSGITGQKVVQHFAMVLDREIKSWPSIDWEQYPNGVSGSSGAQISGIGSLKEARDLATVLRSGALPIGFEVVARRSSR